MYVYNFLFVPGARFKYHKMTTSESRAVSPRSLGQFIHSVLFIFTTRYLTSEPASFFSREACDTCEKPAEVSAIAFFDDVGRRGGWRKEGKGVRARSVHDLYPSYRGRALFLGSKRGVVVARYTFHGPIRSYVLRNAESGFIECSWKLQLHIYTNLIPSCVASAATHARNTVFVDSVQPMFALLYAGVVMGSVKEQRD